MRISLCENSEPCNAEKKSTPCSVGVTLTCFINQLQKKTHWLISLNLKLALQFSFGELLNLKHISLRVFSAYKPYLRRLWLIISCLSVRNTFPFPHGGLRCEIDESISTHSAGISPWGWHEKYFFLQQTAERAALTASLPDAAKSHSVKTTAILQRLVNLTDLIIIGQVRHPSGARRVMVNSEEKESEIHAPLRKKSVCGSVSDKSRLHGQNTLEYLTLRWWKYVHLKRVHTGYNGYYAGCVTLKYKLRYS